MVSNKLGNKSVKSKTGVKIGGAKKWGNVIRRDSRAMTTPGVKSTGKVSRKK